MSAIVALGLLTFSPGRARVEVVTLNAAGRADPRAAAAAYVKHEGVSVVAALSRVLEVEELAAYVPGVARCPDVVWIAGADEELPS